MGDLKAKAIPYKNFKDRIAIMKKERSKNRRVEYDEENVYSFPKNTKRSKFLKFKDGKSSRTAEDFKCNSCGNVFRILALEDIQWAVCIRCGGVNIGELSRLEQHEFKKIIG